MRSILPMRWGHLALWLCLAAPGCGPAGDPEDRTLDPGDPLPRRAGALVVDSCPIDSIQRSRLLSAEARAVVSDVILLCLFARDQGELGPSHPQTKQWLEDDITALKAAGYRVSLGLTLGESNLDVYEPSRASSMLLDQAWVQGVVQATAAWAGRVDGVEIALPQLESRAKPGVEALASGLAGALGPAKVGMFVPPSIALHSDLPGGDAYDLPRLAPSLGRMRVMTLDFSCCDAPGGPSIDPGWAVDAVRFAQQQAPSLAASITVPLFGTDFSPQGARSVTYLEATALARYHGAAVERGPTGAPHFAYDDAGGRHELWYDDAFSTGLLLGAWTTALPAGVGVLYYGLGAEEPGLWASIAQRQR